MSLSVTIEKDGAQFMQPISDGANFSELRNTLSSLGKISDFEEFMIGQITILRGNENEYKILDVTKNATQIIKIKSNQITIKVKKGTASEKLFVVPSNQFLSNFRSTLVASDRTLFSENDIFLSKGTTVEIQDPSVIRIIDALDTQNTLHVKAPKPTVVFPTEPGVIPKPVEVELSRDWIGSKLSSSAQEILNQLDKELNESGTSTPNLVNYTFLTLEQKKQLFLGLRLGTGFIFSPESIQELDQGLKKSFSQAVYYLPTNPDGSESEPIAEIIDPAVTETYLSYSKEIHQYKFHGVYALKGDVKVAGQGFAMSVKADIGEATLTENVRVFLMKKYRIPKVKLTMQQEMMTASDSFVADVKLALRKNSTQAQYLALLDILNKYGHYIPLTYNIGGALIYTDEKIIDSKISASELDVKYSLAVNAKFSIEGIPVDISSGTGGETNLQQKDEIAQYERSIQKFVIGGDPAQNYSAWVASLGPTSTWRILEYDDFTPTIHYLPKELREQVVVVIDEYGFRTADTVAKTVLDMKSYVKPYVEKNIDTGEWD